MTWLKRNLFLAGGSLVALVLLGAAGYYLWTQYNRDADVSGQLTEAIAQFESLTKRKPSVLKENIEAAKEEQKRLDALLEQQRRFFSPFSTLTNLDSEGFSFLLATTIDELEKQAARQGVRTPKDFSYTFPNQRKLLKFDEADLLPWAHQLLEIKALCGAFYDARVHTVANLRRAPTSKKDVGWYVLNRRAVTNAATGTITTPYEVQFHGFGTELAAVLDSLVRSPHCFVVKNVNAEFVGAAQTTDDTSGGAAPSMYAVGQAEPAPLSPAEQMRQRYGLGPGGGGQSAAEIMRNRYGIGPRGAPSPVAPAPAPSVLAGPTAPRRPTTVLDEKLLKFTMLIEAVRLRDAPN